jgi:hypothetical protein
VCRKIHTLPQPHRDRAGCRRKAAGSVVEKQRRDAQVEPRIDRKRDPGDRSQQRDQ